MTCLENLMGIVSPLLFVLFWRIVDGIVMVTAMEQPIQTLQLKYATVEQVMGYDLRFNVSQ